MCNFQQIDPFSKSQKTGLSRHPEVQFEQTSFCFVGFNEFYKIKKFVRIGLLVVEIIEKNSFSKLHQFWQNRVFKKYDLF